MQFFHAGRGCHFLLQGIFPTQGPNPDPGIVGRFFTFRATREAPPLLYVRLKVKLQKSLPGYCSQPRVQVRVTGMNIENTNSHDVLVESQAWKIWKEVQLSTCRSPTWGFNFLLSQRTTERGKVWKEICQTVNHVISRRTGEGEIPRIIYIILHFLQLLTTS